MIASLRRRADFDELRRAGRRVGGRHIWLRFAASSVDELGVDGGESPSAALVAFALPRKLGNAVTRNRVRRRLRALLVECDEQGRLPSGRYLVGATSAATEKVPFAELRGDLVSLLAKVGD